MNNMSHKEFKVIIINMLTRLERRVEKQNFYRERKYKKESELKNTINEMKNTLEGINRLSQGTSNLEDKVPKLTVKNKEFFKK